MVAKQASRGKGGARRGWAARSEFTSMASFQILLATLDGARFLEEQLGSLEGQTVDEIHVLASDDGSSDSTLAILERARERWTKGRFDIIMGPRRGFAHNFRHLVDQAPRDADFYAFCDQDDVWHPDKLRWAAEVSAQTGSERPFLFGSASALIDAHGKPIGRTPQRRRSPGIRNAILENIAGGNTMVMNRPAFRLLAATSSNIGPLSHDHWLYMIIAGTAGVFHFSNQPTVQWRQHDANAIGARISPLYRMPRSRLGRLRRGKLRGRMGTGIRLLDRCHGMLTDEAREVLEECRVIHESPRVWTRAAALRRAGLYRSNRMGQIGLWLDTLLNFKGEPKRAQVHSPSASS